MNKTTEEWIELYKRKGALWIHDGNSKRPHALLTSGKHSNGFFNSRLVVSDQFKLLFAAQDLLEKFNQRGGDISKIQGVVGPQTGATRLAEYLRCLIYLRHFPEECFWCSPEKNESEAKKSMIFNERELDLLRDKAILLCDDVLTTSGSVSLTENAVITAGGKVLPFVLVLVNRSGLKEVNGKKIIALIDRPMPMWEPDECPLCRNGSEALRPKDNWSQLNGY